MPAVVVVSSSDESSFFDTEVAISPTGGWRAAAQKTGSSTWDVLRSSDGGVTWTSIGAPTTNIINEIHVAVTDSGDIHAIALGSSTHGCFYYNYTSGAWSAASTVVAAGGTTQFPVWLGWDGTTIVAIVNPLSGTGATVYYSTTGTTWTAGATLGNSTNFVGLFQGGHIHLFYTPGGTITYARYDVAAHTFGSTTPPAVATNGGTWTVPASLARHGSTSEVWAVQFTLSGLPRNLQIFKSTDSGDNWTTVTTSDTIPTILGTPAAGGGPGGVSMGSDDKLHFWSQGDGTTVKEIARDLAGTWETVASTVAVAGYQARARTAQRNDGTQPNIAEIWMQLQQTNGTATPTRLTLITGVTGPGGWSVGTIKIGG